MIAAWLSALNFLDASPPAHRRVDGAWRAAQAIIASSGTELALVAKSAADIGRDDAQRALSETDLLRHQTADVMGYLC